MLSDFSHRAKVIQKKIATKKNIHVTKKNNNQYLIRNYSKNYGTVVVNKIICNKEDQKVVIKIDKPVNNFSNTIINLDLEQANNVECTHVNLIDKFKNKSILLKIDNINSEFNYKKFRTNKTNSWSKYFFEKDNELFLLSDEINIKQDVYIPKGFKVIIKPGQKILLTDNAFIVSNSAWTIGGDQKKTIITGKKDNLGGGIIIGDNDGLSYSPVDGNIDEFSSNKCGN